MGVGLQLRRDAAGTCPVIRAERSDAAGDGEDWVSRLFPRRPFSTDDSVISESDRAVITFEGSELVRGGGGPRCMTCPISRDDPWT